MSTAAAEDRRQPACALTARSALSLNPDQPQTKALTSSFAVVTAGTNGTALNMTFFPI